MTSLPGRVGHALVETHTQPIHPMPLTLRFNEYIIATKFQKGARSN